VLLCLLLFAEPRAYEVFQVPAQLRACHGQAPLAVAGAPAAAHLVVEQLRCVDICKPNFLCNLAEGFA
jgi:hypothetical protein